MTSVAAAITATPVAATPVASDVGRAAVAAVATSATRVVRSGVHAVIIEPESRGESDGIALRARRITRTRTDGTPDDPNSGHNDDQNDEGDHVHASGSVRPWLRGRTRIGAR